MSTIDDFGGLGEGLDDPPLGGPLGWAAAVRTAIKNAQTAIADNASAIADNVSAIADNVAAIAGKVSKAGDTMTGGLTIQHDAGRSLTLVRTGRPGNALTPQANGALGVTNLAGDNLAPLAVNYPIEGDPFSAANKGYVDAIHKGGGDGAGNAITPGKPLKVYSGYSSVTNGGASANWAAAGFTQPPTLVVNLIGYVDPNVAYTVSSSTLSLTGTTFYVRRITGGVVAAPSGAAVTWTAIGV